MKIRRAFTFCHTTPHSKRNLQALPGKRARSDSKGGTYYDLCLAALALFAFLISLKILSVDPVFDRVFAEFPAVDCTIDYPVARNQ